MPAPAQVQMGFSAWLWGDRCRVDVLVQPAGAVEAGGERRGAGASGFGGAGWVGAVVVTGGVGGGDGVALVGPDHADRVTLGGDGDVVADERHEPAAELLDVGVGGRVGDLDARAPGLAAVGGL